MKNLFFALQLAFAIFFSIVNNTDAQIRTRDELDSLTAVGNGIWYNPSFYQFEIQYPKLQAIPPLSTGMDLETILSYILLDSLMRSVDSDFIYYNYLERWRKTGIKNDTTIMAIKHLYKLVDYDPIKFVQYDANLGKPYKLNLISIKNWTQDLLYNKIGFYGENSVSLGYLLRAQYILKVIVNTIDSIPQRDYPPNKGIIPNSFTYNVNATVIDTLKGKVFKNCNQQFINKNDDNIQSINPQICFTYGTGPYQNEEYQFKLDQFLKNGLGNLKLEVGQELIVFLEHSDYFWDKNYDYFPISLISVFPIINGELKDISKVWSNSVSINYGNWKTIFDQKKTILLNGGY